MKTEKIIQTIKKVLELSKNNPSEDEAKAAALKAQELLAKYHIDMAEIQGIDTDTVDEICEVRVDVPSKKWKYVLADIVSDNFRCKHFYYGKKILVFYGHNTDANVAAETFKYLFHVGNIHAGRMVDKVFKDTGTSAGVYNSFVSGFCKGVKEALTKQCKELMVIVPQDVKDSFAERTKSCKTTTASGLTINNLEAFNEGVTVGHDAIQRRRIEGYENGKK